MVKELQKDNIFDFKEIYDKYCDKFYGIAISICGNVSEAEDIVQDSFLKIFKKINTLNDTDKLENWMYRILVNTAKSSVNRWWRKVDSIDYQSSLQSLNKVQDKNESWDLLVNILQGIPIGYRNVFILHAIQEIPQSDVSIILGISTGTVKSQYHKAKKVLRTKLSEIGVKYE